MYFKNVYTIKTLTPAVSNKMEDDLGHATPSMIAPGNNQSDLIVSGQSIMGNYKPLSSDNLEEKLKKE